MKNIVALTIVLATALHACAGELRGGFARVEITPTKPVTMAGYAARTNVSQGVHDPLSGRAMALEADGKRVVIMSVDNLGWYNDTAEPTRQAILEETKLQPSELLLAAIHTHSAPTLALDSAKSHPNNVEYTRELGHKLASAAKQALENLAPVRLSFGVGYSPVGANRREVTHDTNGAPKIVLGRNPHIPIDREVQVLKLTRNDGELAGIFWDFPTHSTSLGTRNLNISGDIHGLAAQFVEKYFGDKIVAPEFAGASGNIDPWYRVLPTFNTTNNWVPEPILLSTLLGEEVVTVANQIRDRDAVTNPVIKTAMKTVGLPRKPRQQAEAAAVESDAPIVVTIATVGNIAFVGLGGEIFNEIGQAIKKQSPFAHTIVITHCNGAAGYMPIASAYPEGGYEVQSSAFGPGADEQLVKTVGEMLNALK
jgi:hypothetical protein